MQTGQAWLMLDITFRHSMQALVETPFQNAISEIGEDRLYTCSAMDSL
jgi:hypothetical protein